ncbi:sensor histidine kinase [Streptomyces sp. 3N207]|uniref:sensor histidine kinase n=1 Tax=Streptomyces sp. 3N207 TaxID=3457417 RepID=UPI003FD32EC2
MPRREADVLAAFLTLGQTVPLATRARWPASSLGFVWLAFAAYTTLGYPPTFGSMGLYLALYSLGAHQERRRGLALPVVTVAYAGYAAVLHAAGSPHGLLDFVLFYFALAVFWVVGCLVRGRRVAATEREQLAEQVAVAAERARIARELHDVVTHHVTAMVVQADAAQFLADRPDQVAQGMTAISGTGRRALADLRYLLGALEATGESAPPEPSPTPGTLSDLVEQTRLAGQPVELDEEGTPNDAPAAVDMAVYRVVQEALTNAVKYAPGRRTVVHVRHHGDRADVQVTTSGTTTTAAAAGPAPRPAADGPVPSGGRGLRGLRERVGILGGELVAESLPEGGFRVSASLPTGSGAT